MKLLATLTLALALSVSAGAQNATVPVQFSTVCGTPNPASAVCAKVTVPVIPGPPGDAATIAVGSTQTGAPGTPAVVTNSGTSNAAVFNFVVPQGIPGTNGIDGTNGVAATIAVGTVTTGAPGSSATVVNVGTPNAAVLNFTIPQGNAGPPGPPTPYPGVTADGASGLIIAGKITTKEVDTNGPPPNGLTVGTTPGFTGTITPSKATCRITIAGGIIVEVTGC